jgi:hypothetical protein
MITITENLTVTISTQGQTGTQDISGKVDIVKVYLQRTIQQQKKQN